MNILPRIAVFGAWLFAPLLQVEHPPVLVPASTDSAPASAPKEAPPAAPVATPPPKGSTTMR